MNLILFNLILFFIFILLLIFAYYLAKSWLFGTPFYPSSSKDFKKIINDLEINPKDKNLLDLGSGDGRIVLEAAKLGFNATGVEFNPFLTLISRLKFLLAGQKKNAKVLRKDFNTLNFSEFDIIYTYIFPEHLEKVQKKIFNELKAGSMIISKVFTFKDIKEDQKIGQFHIYKIK